DRLADALAPVGQRLLEHRLVDRTLRREVVQQAGPPDADARRDVVERGPLVAALGEAAASLLEDRRPCRAGTTLVRHRAEGIGRSPGAAGGRPAGAPRHPASRTVGPWTSSRPSSSRTRRRGRPSRAARPASTSPACPSRPSRPSRRRARSPPTSWSSPAARPTSRAPACSRSFSAATACRWPATCSPCRSSPAGSPTASCGPSSTSPTMARSRPTAGSTRGRRRSCPTRWSPAPPPEPPVDCAGALSQHPDAAAATGKVVGSVLERLGAGPDLAVVFCTADHLGALADVAAAVRSLLRPRLLVGAAAEGVLGGGTEVEDGPGVSLWAARLPVPPRPVRITAARTPSGTAVAGVGAGTV